MSARVLSLASTAAGLLLLAVGIGGCEKNPPACPQAPGCPTSAPAASDPGSVVIEQPGSAPDAEVGADSGDADSDSAAADAGGDDAGGEGEPQTELIAGDTPCSTDADCAPTSCCHADACGAASDAPDCRTSLCTMDCKAGTMDCFGGCLCRDGRCFAEIWTGSPV